MRRFVLLLVACGSCSSSTDQPTRKEPRYDSQEFRETLAKGMTERLPNYLAVKAEGPAGVNLAIYGGCNAVMLMRLFPDQNAVDLLEKAGFRSIECGDIEVRPVSLVLNIGKSAR